MRKNLFYYTISIYDSRRNEWTTIESNIPMDCENAHRAVSVLNILYRNDMMERPAYYRDLANNGLYVKWSIFKVPMNEDGTLNYTEKRHCYSISSDKRLSAKRIITINDILR